MSPKDPDPSAIPDPDDPGNSPTTLGSPRRGTGDDAAKSPTGDDPGKSPTGDDEPPSEAEIAAAAELRGALDRGSSLEPGNADWALVEAVRAASRPAPIAETTHRRIVKKALSKSTQGRVVYLALGGLASAAAIAAALVLVVRGTRPERMTETPVVTTTPTAVCRSAAELFPDGFPATGGTSDRIDRIAYARARDLRENRFAAWGVR